MSRSPFEKIQFLGPPWQNVETSLNRIVHPALNREASALARQQRLLGVTIVNPTRPKIKSLQSRYPRLLCITLVLDASSRRVTMAAEEHTEGPSAWIEDMIQDWIIDFFQSLQEIAISFPNLTALYIRIEFSPLEMKLERSQTPTIAELIATASEVDRANFPVVEDSFEQQWMFPRSLLHVSCVVVGDKVEASKGLSMPHLLGSVTLELLKRRIPTTTLRTLYVMNCTFGMDEDEILDLRGFVQLQQVVLVNLAEEYSEFLQIDLPESICYVEVSNNFVDEQQLIYSPGTQTAFGCLH